MNISDLLRELAPLARRDTRHVAHCDQFSFISAFVARQTETFHTISMPVAGLLLVLEGTKHLHWAGRDFRYGPGEAFVLPACTVVDVINEPDHVSGMYRALFLGFSADLLAEARRRWSGLASATRQADPRVTITPPLASAILHTSEALAGFVEVSARITAQRLQEILLLLAEAGAAPLRPDLKHCQISDAARLVIREEPCAPWTAAAVAAALCTTEPTMRRHLRAQGTSFRRLLAEERMRAARTLLADGKTKVTEAASAGGYASLSHFAKRYRSIYGHAPSRPD